jgi:hypothetical protein
MEKCCNNLYTLCADIDPCFAVLAVKVPIDYPNQFVTLSFKKNLGNPVGFKADCEVLDGWAVIEVEQQPKAFFNPYGNAYQCEFISTTTYAPVLFTAADGKPYSGFYFNIANNTNDGGYAQLNVIDTEIYVNP